MSESEGQTTPWVARSVPDTGDPAIDAALEDLSAVPGDDLDGVIQAASGVQRTLANRLSGLSGE